MLIENLLLAAVVYLIITRRYLATDVYAIIMSIRNVNTYTVLGREFYSVYNLGSEYKQNNASISNSLACIIPLLFFTSVCLYS